MADLARRPKLRDRLHNPTTWHYLSLAVAALGLAVLARNQWFFFDEWAFLIPGDGGLFSPHVGHWSTSPILLTRALRAVFGVNTYWPYILLTLAIHLAICHVLWRIMRRAGANPWIATALAFLLMVLGAGAENILWAFQIGFMGALLLGLIVVLLIDAPALSRWRLAAIIVLSIWSLTFSGTAIPVLLAAGLVGLARHGVTRTVLLLGPSAVVYACWYAIFQLGKPSPFGASGIAQLVVDVPRYLGHFLIDGLSKVLPFDGLGAVALFCVVLWAVLTFTTWRGPATAAYALGAAAILQGLLTGVSRLALGVDAASSSRYVYALVCLLLPAIALALTWFARERRSVVAVLTGLVLFVAAYNGVLLARESEHQGDVEQQTRQRLYAALDLVTRPGADYDSAVRPVPIFAPDVTVGDLIAMHDAGWIAVGDYDEAARLSVAAILGVAAEPVPAPSGDSGRCVTTTGAEGVDAAAGTAQGTLKLQTDAAMVATIQLGANDATGDARGIPLEPGWTSVDYPAGTTAHVSVQSPPGAVLTVCTGAEQ